MAAAVGLAYGIELATVVGGLEAVVPLRKAGTSGMRATLRRFRRLRSHADALPARWHPRCVRSSRDGLYACLGLAVIASLEAAA